jgi:hypothetical protein
VSQKACARGGPEAEQTGAREENVELLKGDSSKNSSYFGPAQVALCGDVIFDKPTSKYSYSHGQGLR